MTSIESVASTPDGSMVDSDSESESIEADGEIRGLIESLDNESYPLTPELEVALAQSLSNLKLVEDFSADRASKSLSLESAYGHPLSVEDANRLVPPGGGGLIWHSLLINGEPFDEQGNLKKGLNPRDFDATTKTIKPRRASLPVLERQLYSSLTRVDGPNGGARYIFHGILNGWPCLQTFEVLSIQRRRRKQEFVSPLDLISGQRVWAPMWGAEKEGLAGTDPTIKEKGLVFRVKFRSAPWSGRGWSADSPGFAFWYEAHKRILTYGTNMLQTMDETSICTHVHMLAHRYARLKENAKDMLTYHTLVLLEWNHGQYCTVIEAAYLNGLAGYRGKSNFYHDMNEPVTQLYQCFPPEMVCPWLTNAAEIRAFDVEAKNPLEFKSFVTQYEGERFVDPQYCFSHKARLSFRSKRHIAQYLINYIRRDVTYSELSRNCQTLAADLCAFLAGKREVLPYHPVNRIEYKNRTHLFLYDPDLYEEDKPRSSIQANQLRL